MCTYIISELTFGLLRYWENEIDDTVFLKSEYSLHSDVIFPAFCGFNHNVKY